MEREMILKAAVAKCLAAREACNVANVRKYIEPDYPDFFDDFDSPGKSLDDVTIFREIQATFKATPQPQAPLLIKTDPEGHPLRPVEPVEPFPDYLPPSEKIAEPVAEKAEPLASSTQSHEATGPGLSLQAKLDAARVIESNLVAARPSLINAQREARGALSEAVIAFQQIDPHRQTPAQLSAEFRAASQAQRAARKRGEKWATVPERRPGGERAFVDLQRAYGHGGTADDYARKLARTGNRRGAYSAQSLGDMNRDPSRGPTPKPVITRPTIPALSK